MTLLNDFPMCLGLDGLDEIVQAGRNVSKNYETLHNHTDFKPYCVLKMKKEATFVFTESDFMYFSRNYLLPYTKQ